MLKRNDQLSYLIHYSTPYVKSHANYLPQPALLFRQSWVPAHLRRHMRSASSRAPHGTGCWFPHCPTRRRPHLVFPGNLLRKEKRVFPQPDVLFSHFSSGSTSFIFAKYSLNLLCHALCEFLFGTRHIKFNLAFLGKS